MHVRVRGVYSTAITKILLDNGISISHTSKKIRERFSLPENREPPTVTIKDTDQKHGIVIVGEYEHGKRVYEVIRDSIKDCFCWVSKLPLHSIIKGRVIEVKEGKSIVDLGEHKGVINCELETGSEILVDVARPFLPHEDLARLSRNYTIYGKYVALIRGLERKVIFSKHLTNKKLKQDLLAMTTILNIEGWCIKWRSSAAIGDLNQMLKDLQQTFEKAEDIIKRGENANVGEVIYDGEFFAIICFGRNAKNFLDEVRNEVLPTIKNHHILKSMNESEVVDISEHMLSMGVGSRDKISESAMSYITSLMKEQKSISIEHVSVLSGEVKKLTPGKLVEVEGNFYRMKRIFKSKGILDGLNVQKMPGDYDVMEFSTDLPVVLHKYYGKDNDFKGVYVNLNTPPEISRNYIRYIDMEVDVVASDKEVKVIDKELLEKAYNLGIISENTRDYYLSLAESLKEFLLDFEDLSRLTLKELSEVVEM